MSKSRTQLLYSGRYLQMRARGNWEYAHRPKISGIVGIIAVTAKRELVLIRQFRPPVNTQVIEIPAGLAGDIAGSESESLASAARRELLEETGFRARSMRQLTFGVSSAGLCDEVIHLFLATGLERVANAPTDPTEQIETHLVPLNKVEAWIRRQQKSGTQIDLKVFAALHFARQI